MRNRLKSVWNTFNEERGEAFLVVLILLMLGGLMLPPLMGLIGTSLTAGKMYENQSYELYGADAGVTDALWLLQRLEACEEFEEEFEDLYCDGQYTYTLPEEVNGKSVQYEIVIDGVTTDNTTLYLITSTATDINGSITTIEAQVESPPEPDLLYFAAAALDGPLKLNAKIGTESESVNIYANGDIDLIGSSEVYGNAYHTVGYQLNVGNSAIFEGEEILTPELRLAKSAIPAKPEDTEPGMVINSDTELGPVYIDGDLKIKGGVVTLTGPVWVSGYISISGNSVIKGTDADGKLNFLISEYTGNAISISGSWPHNYDYKVEAVLYAPNGSIYVGGEASMTGSAIGESVSVMGASKLTNPLPFEEIPISFDPLIINYWKIY